jgi:hypothetical protein
MIRSKWLYGNRRALGMLLCVATVAPSCVAGAESAAAGKEDRLAGLESVGDICGATQIGFWGNITTLVSTPSVYYREGLGPWKKSSIPLLGHSVTRLPNGHWILNDTERNQLIEATDISGNGKIISRTELAGVKLARPHDQIVDPSTGYVYMVDGNRRLFRLKDLSGPAEVWTFTAEEMGYDRSLSWFDGHLHVIDSSRGEVLRIDDYAKHQYTRFKSPRPDRINPKPFLTYGDRDFMGGSLSATGFILNDVQKMGDWYYGTNMFTKAFALDGDPRPARLVRWKSWADFEQGKWQDLTSHLGNVSDSATPYFLSADENSLYAPLWNSSGKGCNEGRILRLDVSSLPE